MTFDRCRRLLLLTLFACALYACAGDGMLAPELDAGDSDAAATDAAAADAAAPGAYVEVAGGGFAGGYDRGRRRGRDRHRHHVDMARRSAELAAAGARSSTAAVADARAGGRLDGADAARGASAGPAEAAVEAARAAYARRGGRARTVDEEVDATVSAVLAMNPFFGRPRAPLVDCRFLDPLSATAMARCVGEESPSDEALLP